MPINYPIFSLIGVMDMWAQNPFNAKEKMPINYPIFSLIGVMDMWSQLLKNIELGPSYF